MIILHHPAVFPINQMIGSLITLSVMLYAYAFYDLYRHGALRSLLRRGLIRGYQIALFAGGALTLIVALLSALDERADQRFSAHMIQHVLLTMVAPPLLLLGIPSPIARAAFSRRWLRRLVGWLSDPVFVFALFFFIFYVWHIPAMYELALHNPYVHGLQHALFFYSALLFWWRIIDPTNGWYPLWNWPPARWVYLLLAAPASYVLGTVLWGSSEVFYPSYSGAGALADQRLGGSIMWLQGWMFLMISMLIFFRGYHPEQEPV